MKGVTILLIHNAESVDILHLTNDKNNKYLELISPSKDNPLKNLEHVCYLFFRNTDRINLENIGFVCS